MVSRRVALAVAAVALAAPAPAAAGTSDALNAILAFDPARVDTLGGLEQGLRAPGEIAVAGLRRQLAGDDVHRRWAATYVAHVVADDPADQRALRPRLRDPDPSVRALAAFGRAGFGSKDGLGVLADLVSSPYLMAHSDGQALSVLARERLERLTRSRQANWRRWWTRVRDTIRWDRSAQRYRWRGGRASSARSASPLPLARTAAGAVTVPIQIQVLWGPGVTAADKRRTLANIRKAIDHLNGDGRTARCSPLEFTLDLTVGGDPLPDPVYTLVVHELPHRSKNSVRWLTSYVNHASRSGRLWTGEVTADTGHLVLAHEFGHIAGLPDEYYEVVSGGRVLTPPVDPASFMGDTYRGSVLQRHLDYLSRRHDPAGDAGCEHWVLRFATWTSELEAWTDDDRDTNWLGLRASAAVSTYFWASADGRVLPAGSPVCGGEVVPGRRLGQSTGRASRCPDAGGNSEGLDARMFEGEADCGRPPPSLRFERQRFDTVVTRGSRDDASFRLRLSVGDAELAEATHCDPPAEPSITKRYTLIRDGMRFAGALDFTITPPSAQFRREGEHKLAHGNATLTKIG